MTTTTWRDLSGQLTEEQVDRLTAMEQSVEKPHLAADLLLELALAWAEQNFTDDVMFGHIDPPAGARCVSGWLVDGDEATSVWSRAFEGTRRRVSDVDVVIEGRQFHDYGCEREVAVYTDGARLDPAEARQLAAALIAAADEIDRLDR
jgi:hypothetical protein